jgi:xanthine dehydrogenase YagS FAD-binding subunit
MNPFAYVRVTAVDEAIKAYANTPNSRFIGGGTNLLDLMKMGVETPSQLIDITRLPLTEITATANGVRIGALVSNTDAANHQLIRTRYPLLSQAILSGASQQLRNMATMGGNLLQRTRCSYFYDPTYAECNKRNPGSGCAARLGINRTHAILGASQHCIATHPSDMCVALAALEASVQVSGPRGNRTLPFHDFHRLPGATPEIDNNLHPGELIIALDLPASTAAKNSHYLKVRDRNSYAFALVSAAALVDLESDGTVRLVKLAWGGIAHKPWRANLAETLLTGHQLERSRIERAAEQELKNAHVTVQNAFKIKLAQRTMVRALMTAARKDTLG